MKAIEMGPELRRMSWWIRNDRLRCRWPQELHNQAKSEGKRKNVGAGTRLADRRALMTAAGAGIGREVANTFAAAGAQVLACDIDGEALARLDAQTAILDVTDAAAIRTLAVHAGDVDILVNGAGIVHAGSVLDCAEEECAFAVGLTPWRCVDSSKPFCLACLKDAAVLSSLSHLWRRP